MTWPAWNNGRANQAVNGAECPDSAAAAHRYYSRPCRGDDDRAHYDIFYNKLSLSFEYHTYPMQNYKFSGCLIQRQTTCVLLQVYLSTTLPSWVYPLQTSSSCSVASGSERVAPPTVQHLREELHVKIYRILSNCSVFPRAPRKEGCDS